MVFDQLVPNKLMGYRWHWRLEHETADSNFTWTTPIIWNDQSLGSNNWLPMKLLCRRAASGSCLLGSCLLYLAIRMYFPRAMARLRVTFAAGWSIDYASSNPSFLVGIADNWGTRAVQDTRPMAARPGLPSQLSVRCRQQFYWRNDCSKHADKHYMGACRRVRPYYTLNGGVTWSPVVLPGVSSWSGFDFAYYFDARTVTADRVLPNTFYLYFAGQGVYETTNGGATWTQVFSGQISPCSGFNARNSICSRRSRQSVLLPEDCKIISLQSIFINRPMGGRHGRLFPTLLK